MELTSLTAVSPLDGRYASKTEELRPIFSEYGLMRFRVQVELTWLKHLSLCDKIKEVPVFSKDTLSFIDNLIKNFSVEDAQNIKDREKTTNHDVKAVEYFLKDKVQNLSEIEKVKEFIHFACTSEDINNNSHALMLKTARDEVLLPLWDKVIEAITKLAHDYADIPLLARTHGQPASPTTIGKEMANVVYRLKRQYEILKNVPIMGKIKFVATDYNQFLVKPIGLRIMVAYPGFLPHRYSVVRGVPFDATTGVYFITNELTELSTEGDGSATLGYDYVMVNGDESSVTVALGLYNDEGKLVGQSGNINVPIRRGGLTVVKGHFLTKTQSSGGIGIDPNFEGDINVYY